MHVAILLVCPRNYVPRADSKFAISDLATLTLFSPKIVKSAKIGSVNVDLFFIIFVGFCLFRAAVAFKVYPWHEILLKWAVICNYVAWNLIVWFVGRDYWDST